MKLTVRQLNIIAGGLSDLDGQFHIMKLIQGEQSVKVANTFSQDVREKVFPRMPTRAPFLNNFKSSPSLARVGQ
jgi:hypothetical protein